MLLVASIVGCKATASPTCNQFPAWIPQLEEHTHCRALPVGYILLSAESTLMNAQSPPPQRALPSMGRVCTPMHSLKAKRHDNTAGNSLTLACTWSRALWPLSSKCVCTHVCLPWVLGLTLRHRAPAESPLLSDPAPTTRVPGIPTPGSCEMHMQNLLRHNKTLEGLPSWQTRHSKMAPYPCCRRPTASIEICTHCTHTFTAAGHAYRRAALCTSPDAPQLSLPQRSCQQADVHTPHLITP